MSVYGERSAQEHSWLRKRIGRDQRWKARQKRQPSLHLDLAQIIDVTCIRSIFTASVWVVW
jgi:hypothetical protein